MERQVSLSQARTSFVDSWGKLGLEWGINRAMGQIHALLLSSSRSLDAEEIMGELSISRGNANTNLRALMDWGLVSRDYRPGMRREFFSAEKDVWRMARLIAERRRRKELDPLLTLLESLAKIEPSRGEDPAEVRQFQRTIRDIQGFGQKASRILDLLQRLDENAFIARLMSLLKAG